MRVSMPSVCRGTLALLVGLGTAATAGAPKNFGVDSINQPVVSATRAIVPTCPEWSSANRDSAALTDNNYGCAINSNLAAMIANPLDLLHGQIDDSTETESAVRAVKAWREAQPTSKLWTTTTKVSTKSGGSE